MKVVVADDEYFARKALVKMLTKMDMPIEICADCENGQEVVEAMEECPVDLIITDIRMPEMDGLQLAKYVSEHGIDTSIIIETGYADFYYAQTAMRYGVREYLTKPLNDMELRDSIQKVMEERVRKSAKDISNLSNFSYILQKRSLCRQVLEWGEKQEKSCYCMILTNGTKSAENTERIQKLLSGSGRFPEMRSFYSEANQEGILLAFADTEAQLEQAFARLSGPDLEQELPENVWISFSCQHSGEKTLEQAYRECIYGMNERLMSRKRVLFYKPQNEFCEIVTWEKEQILYNALVRGEAEEAEKIVQEVFEEARKKSGNVYSLFVALMRIFFVFNRVFYQNNNEKAGEESLAEYLLFDFKMDLYQFHDLEEVRQYVNMILKEVCRKNTDEENTSVIENLLEYLERNYSYDISLADLAERKYFVSPSYLRRLFKAYTGQSFMKYLINLRMEKAKDFLENSSMEIRDIAICTGFNDPSHFTQTFRRFFGVSPKEYRKRAAK